MPCNAVHRFAESRHLHGDRAAARRGVRVDDRCVRVASNFIVFASVWSLTPVLATSIMMLVVIRDRHSKEGWRVLVLQRLGLRYW